jgi:hypothetical protein
VVCGGQINLNCPSVLVKDEPGSFLWLDILAGAMSSPTLESWTAAAAPPPSAILQGVHLYLTHRGIISPFQPFRAVVIPSSLVFRGWGQINTITINLVTQT